ncbi:MAG: alpha-glucosidase [Faecalibacterium sp.]|jgi:oligo-1,6-glucosidase|nr:alpha-glucosidase [Faecalibacterium sp.]
MTQTMQQLPWWKKCVFYQIYPRSFQDSDGDGIGDLRGILQRLDYLKALGIGAVWLCPVYDSPNTDGGYDIRDYEKIMADFGTMADFDALLAGLHVRGIRLVMDLVVNHTSDEHAWFVESRKSRSSPYRDYYLWRDGKAGKEPNNWASFFTPSAWSYDAPTKQWYLHLFSQKQPDLNWENPALRESVYGMINRWLDKGVDGFRMDVITLIAKNPALADGCGRPNENGYVMADEQFALQPALHAYLREMRQKCFAGRDCMCVGEGTFANEKTAPALVRDGQELDLLFQFDLMDIDGGRDKWDVVPFDLRRWKAIVAKWQKTLDWNTLFLSNHDQPRPVSRFGCTENETLRIRSAKLLACMMHLMRGTSFLYQGEELGMTNMPFAAEGALRDIESLELLKTAHTPAQREALWQAILKKGRDNARTPMQWNAEPNAGFTTGTPWIDVNPNSRTIHAAAESEDPDSVLNFYRKLIKLKTEMPVFCCGTFRLLDWGGGQGLAFCRENGTDKACVFCNVSSAPLPMPELYRHLSLLLGNVPDPQKDRLLPWEVRVLQ